MMGKIKFSLFLILIINFIYFVSASADGIATIQPNQFVSTNSNWVWPASYYFSGYTNASVFIQAIGGYAGDGYFPETLTANISDPTYSSNVFNNEQVNWSLYSTGVDIWLELDSYTDPIVYEVNFSVWNETDNSYYWGYFWVYVGFDNPPQKIATMSPAFEIRGNDSLILEYPDFWSDYTKEYVWWLLPTGSPVSIASVLGGSVQCETGYEYFNICLHDPDGPDNAFLNITGKGYDYTKTFYMAVDNEIYDYDFPGTYEIVNKFQVTFRAGSSPYVQYNDSSDNSVYQWASISPLFLGYDSQIDSYAGMFFANYEQITVSWEDDTLSQTASLSTSLNGQPSCVVGDFSICLYPQGDNIQIAHLSLGKDKQKTFFISASNGFGSVTANYTVNSTSTSGLVTAEDLKEGESIFSYITGMFMNLFPEKDTLSVKYRFAFVFVTLSVVTLILLTIFYNTVGIRTGAIYLVLFLNVLLIFYFVAIRYIPVVVVALFGIVSLALAYFKVRS